MARVVNEQEYKQKRTEILNTAQKLVYTIGYEQMTIQDILDEMQMSKGAFYHYFESKSALLEALISHMLHGVVDVLQPIVEDPDLSGLEKLNKYFENAASWKTARKPFFLALLQSWYSDGNTIVRYKSERASICLVKPMMNQMIAQAIEEGTMHTEYPEFAAELVFNIFLGLGEDMVQHVLSPDPDPDFKRMLLAHTSAIERVLGTEPGKLVFMDPDFLDEWREPIKNE
ncbi:MAG: TetR/AcrR family transcriptional regulator [Anaerolineaceae bacterium]|nr:TetR/AcrR family transcriptional regulator [Anaerolineaceae bacterium]